MITISLTTIIAGAGVVGLAIAGSLVNPFLRSLRFPRESKEEALETESGEQPRQQQPENPKPQPPVTVLITARDNLTELERNLPSFLQQQYEGEWQVIVVCQSTDGDTQDYLKRMAAENPHLYYTYIPESSRYMSREKLQVTLGVKAAQNEWIILTAPSCKPSSDRWLARMTQQCREPNHLVLGYVGLDEETRGVRRFENIRKAFYLLRRAQHSRGYCTHMPLVAFRKSDFMREQGYQGNLELVRGEYDFLVNKYAHYGETAVELNSEAWLTSDKPSDKDWHNNHLYFLASRGTLEKSSSMRALMLMDHLLPHLSLVASIAVLTFSILESNWILTGVAGFAFLLLILLRMLIARKAVRHFDDNLSLLMLPLYEYGIVWRNLADKMRYWRADKNDFTSHKS